MLEKGKFDKWRSQGVVLISLELVIGIVVKKCYGVRCRRWFMVDLVFLGGIVTRDSENLAMRDERMLSG